MSVDDQNLSPQFLAAEKLIRGKEPGDVEPDIVDRIAELADQAPDTEAQLFGDLLEAAIILTLDRCRWSRFPPRPARPPDSDSRLQIADMNAFPTLSAFPA